MAPPVALFRYSGNKGRMLRHYPDPLFPKSGRIVEPYLGSGAYALNAIAQNSDLTAVGYDISEDVVDLWRWLSGPSAREELLDLDRWYQTQTEKRDIRTIAGLTPGMRLYLKVNVCGAYVGQLSSWSIYPTQHRLPVQATLEALPLLSRISVIRGDGADHTPMPGDVYFVDPPYIGTSGNYSQKSYDPDATIALLTRLGNAPTMITYGDSAETTFPGLPWELACIRRVPVLRGGGTIARREYFARMNWEHPHRASTLR